MKIKVIPTILSLAISGLIAYGLYSWCQFTDYKTLVSVFGGISMLITLWGTIGFSMKDKRQGVNLKISSAVFALLLLISNIVFCSLKSFSQPLYIIVNAALLLIWLVIVYAVSQSANKEDAK